MISVEDLLPIRSLSNSHISFNLYLSAYINQKFIGDFQINATIFFNDETQELNVI